MKRITQPTTPIASAWRRLATGAVMLALLVAFSACEDQPELADEDLGADVEADTMATMATGVVEVGLVSYEIQMPEVLPAGPTTFEVTNTGTEEHNFEIEGQGIEREFDAALQPGETETMQVDLEPGTYRVYCPVADHAEQGMEFDLTVEGGGMEDM